MDSELQNDVPTEIFIINDESGATHFSDGQIPPFIIA